MASYLGPGHGNCVAYALDSPVDLCPTESQARFRAPRSDEGPEFVGFFEQGGFSHIAVLETASGPIGTWVVRSKCGSMAGLYRHTVAEALVGFPAALEDRRAHVGLTRADLRAFLQGRPTTLRFHGEPRPLVCA